MRYEFTIESAVNAMKAADEDGQQHLERIRSLSGKKRGELHRKQARGGDRRPRKALIPDQNRAVFTLKMGCQFGMANLGR